MKLVVLNIFFILSILVVHSECAKKWLSQVKGYNKNDANNGYAGIFGKAVTGLRVSGGKAYRVHIKGGKWLSSVSGNNVNDDNN
jgi:membrane protein implicated in regulation of membrane protease activity